MVKVALYISGHGYGHGTRVMEVARRLLALRPDVRFRIVSRIPDWLICLNLDGYAEHLPLEIDTGVKQTDSYFPDKRATLEVAAAFWRSSEQLVRREAETLRAEGTRLVLADLPPLAFEIAEQAEVIAVGMGNFSWDWIYEPYAEEFPDYEWVVARIQQAYARCPLLLRLPFHGGLQAFPRWLDIPLVARHAERDPEEVRDQIGLVEETRPVVLIALRGEDMARVNWREVEKASTAYRFVTFHPVPLPQVLSLPPDLMRFQELVNAADIVLSKPGYGIVSECIANRKPLLYTERFEFREYEVLVRALDEYGWSCCIPHAEFLAGNWLPFLAKIQAKLAHPPKTYPTNGAEVAASILAEVLEGSRLPEAAGIA